MLRCGGRINGQSDLTGRTVRIVEAPLSAASKDVDFDKMLAFVLNQSASGADTKAPRSP